MATDDFLHLLRAAQEAVQFTPWGHLVANQPPHVRVWARCVVNPESECWEYQGSLAGGYGRLGINKQSFAAHRIAYDAAFGDLKSDLVVCHRCDNPCCCNPAHLFMGTQADNNADRHQKGRSVMPTNGPAVLHAKKVCKNGHLRSGDNILIKGNRWICRACKREAQRRYVARKRAA